MLANPVVFDPSKAVGSWRDASFAVAAFEQWSEHQERRQFRNAFFHSDIIVGGSGQMRAMHDYWKRLVEWFHRPVFVDGDSNHHSALVHTWHHFVVEGAQRQVARNLRVVEGSNRVAAIREGARWSLSRRVAERTFDALRDALAPVAQGIGSVLVTVKLILHEAYDAVRLVFQNQCPPHSIPSTREWTHDFFIHTGFSPPLNLRVSEHLVHGGKIGFGGRPYSSKNLSGLRRTKDSRDCLGERVSEGKPSLGRSKLVNDWSNHSSRKAIRGPFYRSGRRALGYCVRLELRRGPLVRVAN